MSNNTSNVSFPEVLKVAIDHCLSDVNTCLPGRIVKIIDFKKRKISVQPELKKVYLDKTILEPPIIENVPLKYTGNSEAILHFPIKVGDKVILIFSQRSLDNWLSKDEVSEPGNNSKFDISDVFAIPGIQAFKNEHSLIENNEDVVLEYDGKKIVLIKGGALQFDIGTNKFIFNNAVEDLAKLMADLLDEIVAIQTVGSPPQHVLAPASIVNFTAIKTRIALLLEES